MEISALPTAVIIGIVLLVAFVALRIILKITHILFTVGCLAVIVLAVLIVLLGGVPLSLP